MRRSRTIRPLLRRAPVAALCAAALGYAWWASGLRPFSALAEAAVAIPVLVTGLLLALGRRARRPRPVGPAQAPERASWAPAAALAGCCIALEAVALALGGRSSAVPSLSTVVDHALAWRAERGALLAAWLGIGWRLALVHRPAARFPRRVA